MFKIITYSILLVKTYDNEFLCFFNDIFCKKYDKKVIFKNRKSSLRGAQAAFSLKSTTYLSVAADKIFAAG